MKKDGSTTARLGGVYESTIWAKAASTLIAVAFASSTLAAPCPDRSELRQPFFGDLHVHTRYSLDASTQGTLTTPHQAYAFAQGETIPIQPWVDGKALRSLKLSRPLDFAMVSDHAELIGEVSTCTSPNHPEYDAWQCDLYRDFPRGAFYWFNFWSSQHAERVGFCGDDGSVCREQARSPWSEMRSAAAAQTQDCEFSAFVGYEWTGGFVGELEGNIHRNVVFKSDQVPDLPISFMEESTAEGLYAALDRQCREEEGCAAIVIPHNSNLSAGIMFLDPADAEAAALRQRYERLAEIMQHKGASECYYDPLGSTDELCAFEQLPTRSWTEDIPPQRYDGFLRDVLGRGLEQQRALGVNPFEFGFIGSTDTHLGAPGAADEDVFLGHGGAGVPAGDGVPPGLPDFLEYNPGGLAVLWAEENTRDALFGAMQRREAYATSGPRIVARFFAGTAFDASLCDGNVAEQGYAQGVPMGGTLSSPNGAPVFAVQAQQDAFTIGLERVQIIKGWLDSSGKRQEQVIDVASAQGAPTVDEDTCEVTAPGAASLCAVWRDESYSAGEQAFYYARVIEGPTCRWSQRQCVSAGVVCSDPDTITEGFEGCCAADHRKVIRERAWTSPIWVGGEG